jgi:Domain of unknown function (DUF4419)
VSIEQFVPAFSTTGPVERVAAEVVLQGAMQSYFEYFVRTMCGIPPIILEGTGEDWKALADRAPVFREFGLGAWLEVLAPILDQFARASQGDVDPAFWQSLYKVNDQSGGPVITGWITAFFPCFKDHETGNAAMPMAQIFGHRGDLDSMLYPGEKPKRGWAHGPTLQQLPGGLSKAPFRRDYPGRSFDMAFLGGFVGVAQDQETLTLRPEIGWAVREVSCSSA